MVAACNDLLNFVAIAPFNFWNPMNLRFENKNQFTKPTHYNSGLNAIVVNYNDVYEFIFKSQGVTEIAFHNCHKVAIHKIECLIESLINSIQNHARSVATGAQ